MRFNWQRHNSAASLNDPLLAGEDGSTENDRQPEDLDDLVAKFGRSLLNASPKDISRLKAAVENDNAEEVSEIIGTPVTSINPLANEAEFSTIDMSQDSLFKTAVEERKTEWVEFFLKQICDKSIRFEVAASMMKESFNNLVLDYRFLLEDMMKNDVLGWDICKIEVPLETFTIDSNMGSRVGTCNTITEWLEASQAAAGFEHWRSLNSKGVVKVLKKSRRQTMNAIVRIFCVENACQIGLDGTVRLLLMHKAPSSLFATPLLKWVIIFKWERHWKVPAFRHFVSFLLFFVGIHTFLFLIVYDDDVGPPLFLTLCAGVLFLICSFAVVLFPIVGLRRAYFQLRRCILDGQKVFPSKRFIGIRNYFCSLPNKIDFTIVGLVLVMIVTISLDLSDKDAGVETEGTTSALAMEVLLLWAKAFYLTQAFSKSGIFVVMVKRVLKECVPYFLMLLAIMISFGFAMRVSFLDFSGNREHAEPVWKLERGNYRSLIDERFHTLKAVLDDDADERSMDTFGSLYKTVLTMTYAMVGLFDPEVLLRCGSSKEFMIALFVVYLILQSIVMFNMLIASMGDAFDGVRAAEEELFHMARANFIDQHEASISNKAIQKIKGKTGKYLYVLMPEDKQLEENVPLWKGRIPTIKEDVTKIVTDSQSQQNENMNEMIKTLREDIKNDMKTLNEDIKNDMKTLKEEIVTLKERINDQNASH